MKLNHTFIIAALLGLLVLSGCATGPGSAGPMGTHSSGFPVGNNPEQNYAYAQQSWESGEFVEAAQAFERAAKVRTVSGLLEYECLLNATFAWVEAGFPDKARAALTRANSIPVQAAPSKRARYLNALLLGTDEPMLASQLRASLPQ